MSNKYDALVTRFLNAEPIQQMAARMILLALQEDAIDPLIDAYYAGVNQQNGIKIIHLLTEIGGYQALHMLREIIKHDKKRIPLRVVAAQGLLYHSDRLDPREVQALERFLDKYTSYLEEED